MQIQDFNFAGKRAFVRVDFNVPFDEQFQITDDTRMRAALPTLRKIIADGGMPIIASHLGRPKGRDSEFSLLHIRSHLAEILGCEVHFSPDCVGEKTMTAAQVLKPGEVLLLENLRFHEEEEGKLRVTPVSPEEEREMKADLKERQKLFVAALAALADCYVNDAFGTAHRAHASTALIASQFDENHKMFGFLMAQEVAAVARVMQDIQHPFTAIMGGSKVSSKIEIIDSLLDKVDNLILTGGMAYTFARAAGGKIGLSICEEDKLDLAREIVCRAAQKGVHLVVSADAKIADAFSNDARTDYADNKCIPDGWEGMDIGPESIELFRQIILASKTILWNGPTGVFEFENFTAGSRAVAQAIAEATAAGAYSLVGGGDSVACVNKFGMADRMSYVSTGGGALLEAIEGKVLPGIAAIEA